MSAIEYTQPELTPEEEAEILEYHKNLRRPLLEYSPIARPLVKSKSKNTPSTFISKAAKQVAAIALPPPKKKQPRTSAPLLSSSRKSNQTSYQLPPEAITVALGVAGDLVNMPKKTPGPVVKTSKPSVPSGSKAMTSSMYYAPAAISRRLNVKNKPKLVTNNNNVVVTHSEMIGIIRSSGTSLGYFADNFVVNPGNFATFPWLSSFASNFDKYKMRKLEFEFVSNQPTSIAGKVGIGFDFDSTDPLPADRSEFFSLTLHSECSAWDRIALKVPCDNVTRFVNSHTKTDSKLIDVGQFIVFADQIVAATSFLGDVIVHYTCELLEPQQAIYSTEMFYGANPAAFSSLVSSGPNVVTMVPTTSTTVLEFELTPGYYICSINIHDSGGGTPVVAVATYTATFVTANTSGFEGGVNFGNIISKVRALRSGARLRYTFSGVTIANLERVAISFTRISATAASGFDYDTIMPTY